MVGGRRRTDGPEALRRGVPDARLSDQTAPGRDRARLDPTPSRRPTAAAVANRPAEPGEPVSRSRLPLPPVPASVRPSLPLEQRAGALAESLRAAEAAAARRKRVWADDEAEPLSTGPSVISSGAPAPRLPRQTSGASDSRYGDWTKPSRSGELPSEEEMRAALAPAPATSLIPERSAAQRDEDIPDLDEEMPARPARGSSRPAAVGGRAALRAERQAADDARRRVAKENGVALLDDEPRRAPRRMAKGLVAMGVVALGVLGVYQVTSPKTDEAASTRNTPATTSVAPVTPLPPLPELDTGEATAPVEEVAPSTPVRVPVTVLNATDVTGLAAKISGAVVGGGWEAAGVGAYTGDDVAASTVYYTEGDETQRQAALQLVDQFPELQGPALRFFDLPADVTTPGLVIVAAGEWQP